MVFAIRQVPMGVKHGVIQVERVGKNVWPTHRREKRQLFHVEPGEVFGLLGPNGAGKTTTLRMLSTTMRPTRGTARVAGYDVVREPEQVRAHLGVLPTDPGLYGRLTAAENLRFYGRLCGLRGARARAAHRRAAWTGSGCRSSRTSAPSISRKACGKKWRWPGRCCTRRRCSFWTSRRRGWTCWRHARSSSSFGKARRAGRSVLFSSHYLLEADRVCDRVAIIVNGEICTMGTPAEVCREVGVDNLEDAFAYWVETLGASESGGGRAGAEEVGSRVV